MPHTSIYSKFFKINQSRNKLSKAVINIEKIYCSFYYYYCSFFYVSIGFEWIIISVQLRSSRKARFVLCLDLSVAW